MESLTHRPGGRQEAGCEINGFALSVRATTFWNKTINCVLPGKELLLSGSL